MTTAPTIARHENYAEGDHAIHRCPEHVRAIFVGRASRVGFRDRIPRIFQLRDSPPCTFSVGSLDCGEAQYAILGFEDDYKDQIYDETARQSRWALGIGLTIFGFYIQTFSKAPTKNRGLRLFGR